MINHGAPSTVRYGTERYGTVRYGTVRLAGWPPGQPPAGRSTGRRVGRPAGRPTGWPAGLRKDGKPLAGRPEPIGHIFVLDFLFCKNTTCLNRKRNAFETKCKNSIFNKRNLKISKFTCKKKVGLIAKKGEKTKLFKKGKLKLTIKNKTI